jgi:hypothetical protein
MLGAARWMAVADPAASCPMAGPAVNNDANNANKRATTEKPREMLISILPDGNMPAREYLVAESLSKLS